MLGVGIDEPGVFRYPYPVPMNTAITNWSHVDVGQVLAVAIGNGGRLYAWGDQSMGPGSDPNITSPTQLGSASNWVDTQTCEFQAVALNSDGQLFGFGDLYYGQGGSLDEDGELYVYPWSSMVDISDGKVISKVALGWYHLMILDSVGKLFVRGANFSGELGIGSEDTDYWTSSWTAVMADKTFSYIYADYSVSMAIENNGTIWIWGAIPSTGDDAGLVTAPVQWSPGE
jgi:alpha-tubulin suppressor-like RCC1 family protein